MSRYSWSPSYDEFLVHVIDKDGIKAKYTLSEGLIIILTNNGKCYVWLCQTHVTFNSLHELITETYVGEELFEIIFGCT